MKPTEVSEGMKAFKNLKPYSRWGIGALAVVLIVAGVALLATSRNRNSVEARGTSSDNSASEVIFASPGRVEGASETTQVGAAADGVLKAVYVKEGQSVKRGTLLGEIACDELQASLQTALAEAEVMAAEGRVKTVQERIGKCSIAAPIDGTVLRVYARRGESFSTVTPRPLFSLADTSARHIRAEIDERDVDRVSLGQKVVIEADALDGKKLKGCVAKISDMMGRKSISTGDPADKSDRDVLEAVIDLEDSSRPLPIGLRVTVQFLSNGSNASRRDR